MKKLDDITDLRDAIATHAAALAAGDSATAEKFVLPDAIESHRQAAAEIARIEKPRKVETLALAKIGFQYISKLRFTNGGAMRRVLYRWRKEADGKWVIVERRGHDRQALVVERHSRSCGGGCASSRGERQCLIWENAAM